MVNDVTMDICRGNILVLYCIGTVIDYYVKMKMLIAVMLRNLLGYFSRFSLCQLPKNIISCEDFFLVDFFSKKSATRKVPAS